MATTLTAWKLKPTKANDGFESLARGYARAFSPSNASVVDIAKVICRQNGISYSVPVIEDWIVRVGGSRFPFDKKNNPGMYGGPKNVGWAHFNEGNMIMLPDIERADGEPAPREQGPPALNQTSSKMPLVAGLLALFGAVLLFGGKKKNTAKAD